MKKDFGRAEWRRMRGTIKHYWGQLTEAELDQIGGNGEMLKAKLQERYGYTREQAEKECELHLAITPADAI